jgi:peptidoglycan/LPS O-acetylase OafA/YrhL
MSPRSIWTACLMALTVFTPMGACAGLPDGLATEPTGPDGFRRGNRPGRSIRTARSTRPGPSRRVVPVLSLFATSGSGLPVPQPEPTSDPAASLIWPAMALIVIAFAALLIRVPSSRRPLAALAMVAVALGGAVFIALVGIMSSWTDAGTNIPPLFLGAAIGWALAFLAGAVAVLPRSRAPR